LLGADAAALTIFIGSAGPVTPPIVSGGLLVVALLQRWGRYRERFALSWLQDVPALAGACVAGFVTAAAFAEVSGERWGHGGLWSWGLILVGLIAGRSAVVSSAGALRRHGRLGRRVIVVGQPSVTARLGTDMEAHPEYGARLVGTLELGRAWGNGARGEWNELAESVVDRRATDVVLVSAGSDDPDLPNIRAATRELACRVHLATSSEGPQPPGPPDRIWTTRVHQLGRSPSAGARWWAKRALDVVLSVIALVLASPVLFAVALAVRLEGGPGVIFRQPRVGRDGAPFTMYKFRSFRHAAAEEHLTRWTLANEGRVGPVGRTIRKYSLDELPQLYNVLRGDMSLVGPRPERSHFVKRFSAEHVGYAERHRVRPGLTGLAAVHALRGDSSIEDRVAFDNMYIDHGSLWLDLEILLRTVVVVVRGTGS
jgi:exopolysaccharide biosynthesis polyprenyl glycosylphosphotransferase